KALQQIAPQTIDTNRDNMLDLSLGACGRKQKDAEDLAEPPDRGPLLGQGDGRMSEQHSRQTEPQRYGHQCPPAVRPASYRDRRKSPQANTSSVLGALRCGTYQSASIHARMS